MIVYTNKRLRVSPLLVAGGIVGFALAMPIAAKADLTAVTPSGSFLLGTDYPGYLLGYYFTPDYDLSVTALGYYDDQNDGFNSSHEVGIYDSSSGNLLFSTTLASGTSETLSAGYRYSGVSPYFLTAGIEYAIVGTGGTDNYLADTGNPSTNGITLTSGGQYGYGNALAATPSIPSNFGFSVSPFPNQYSLYGGPNFQFVATVPEPGVGVFAVAAAGGLLLLARRRRI